MTAWFHARFGAVVVAIVSTLVLTAPANVAARRPHTTSAAKPPARPRTRPAPAGQRIYAPLGEPASRVDADLLLNNNSPDSLDVTPTFFRHGQGIRGAAVTLAAGEVRWIPMAS